MYQEHLCEPAVVECVNFFGYFLAFWSYDVELEFCALGSEGLNQALYFHFGAVCVKLPLGVYIHITIDESLIPLRILASNFSESSVTTVTAI